MNEKVVQLQEEAKRCERWLVENESEIIRLKQEAKKKRKRLDEIRRLLGDDPAPTPTHTEDFSF